MHRPFAWLVLAAACLATAAAPADPHLPASFGEVRPAALRAHMAFLAGDLLQGRGTATREYEIAAKYVAAQFEAAGLEPGVNGGWLQPVPLRRSELDPEASSVEIVQPDGERKRLVFAEDYVMGGSLSPATEIEAPVVFAGYGITAPELGHDDYAGVDAKGKIVAFLGGAPATFQREERTYYASVKGQNAVAHGAVGTLRLWSAEEEKSGPWSGVVRSLARSPTFTWLDGEEPHGSFPQLRGNAWLGPAVSGVPLRARIIKKSVLTDARSPNVVALLPGSDPRLRAEYVVFTAHLDHLGTGEAVNGDSIYNGAVDNASGVAALIEIARVFASLPERPRRSLLFVAFTGEEPGLLGSSYFVHHPPVPIDSIVANVNIDGASVWPYDGLIPRGAEHSTLAQVVEAAALAAGAKIVPDPFPDRVSFAGSDQYSFVERGIPALNVGTARSGEARRLALEWVTTRYHAPSDDMQQPMDFTATARFVRDLCFIGDFIAQDDERPRWNAGNFYGERFGRATVDPFLSYPEERKP
ncbi:MAG TPA: M28 family metallopeptidase [Thermoanaerobaculia bacterium]|nr:M28 family metallopeptidase [Thermoanaerobaculia bacterium]